MVAIACLVPLTIGGISIVRGPGWLGHAPAIPHDLDSQFRYVSGISSPSALPSRAAYPASSTRARGFACSAYWWWRVPRAAAVLGDDRRAVRRDRLGLVMELGVVPLLMLWQARIARGR